MESLITSPYQIRGTSWVWRSTTESLARQQVSALAVLEVLVSMLVYWWFASITDWPLLTLIAFLAVPFLMLRSPKSTHHAQILLKRFWRERRHGSSLGSLCVVGLISVVLGFLIPFKFGKYLIIDHDLWSLVTSASLMAVITIALATAPSIAIFGSKSHPVPLALVLSSIGAFSILVPLIIMSLCIALFIGIATRFLANKNFGLVIIIVIFAAIFIIPGNVFGILIRVQFIRMLATLRYVSKGMSCFSKNYRESTFVVDGFQIPQVLPGLKIINQEFEFFSIFRLGKNKEMPWGFAFAIKALFLPAIIFIATLYRINVKANVWIWGTLSFALNPRRWCNDNTERSKISNLANAVVQLLMLSVVLGLVAILGKEWLPATYVDLARNAAGEWLKPIFEMLGNMHTYSLRYFSLVMLAVSLIWLLIKAFTFGNANSGVLTNPADWEQLSEKGKAEPVRQGGLQVLRALKWALVSSIFTVWIFTFWAVTNTAWGQSRLPYAVWTWVRPYL
jgi:hypothetical protein